MATAATVATTPRLSPRTKDLSPFQVAFAAATTVSFMVSHSIVSLRFSMCPSLDEHTQRGDPVMDFERS